MTFIVLSGVSKLHVATYGKDDAEQIVKYFNSKKQNDQPEFFYREVPLCLDIKDFIKTNQKLCEDKINQLQKQIEELKKYTDDGPKPRGRPRRKSVAFKYST